MKLSKIVDAVNAKSFGETSWTYEDILPYFQQAVAEINGELESFRKIEEPPVSSESDPFYQISVYTAIPDIHIQNYIVTYITVAMDNAQLAVTSRTQTYATQLAKYKQQLVSDLYKWMPVKESNLYFDLDNTGHKNSRIPNVGNTKYDEDEGGRLSANTSTAGLYQTLPIKGVHCDNPYGVLVPADKKQKILLGTYLYDYIFIPFEAFRQYYDPVGVKVAITGYNIPYSANNLGMGFIYDLDAYKGNTPVFTTMTLLFKAVWEFMKGDNGVAISTSPNVISGSYVSEGNTHTFIFSHYGNKLMAISGYELYIITDGNGNYQDTRYLTNDGKVQYKDGAFRYNYDGEADMTADATKVATQYHIHDLQVQVNGINSGNAAVIPDADLDTYFPDLSQEVENNG